ncbi:restriction endonuclease subunit S [Corynebacterium tuberculostearicum]|uniref:restriction endonuclease subunit S n=1 Tax=Corynebacterium tuberculostearicum TaxID=38304 RepID=UPI0026470525|nr:restriction endonuclease subunit S [Corynebacterium tuberculostearicum]MDV2433072.1 restriction endonuclease subunit S [Corynebacterium tuberculostearicum]WKE60642.1 restriction endonuclease subunit S [Corynebacterium tuberculostearicum]
MRTTTLEEVLDEIIDHRGRTPKKLGADFTNAGVPVISAKLIRQGAIDFENVRFVSHETWEKWMPLPLREGDVILTSEAPLGKTAFVPSNDPLVLGQRLFALRGKADVIDNAYLRYWLESEVGQAQLAGRASGTTVLGIRQALLRKVEIDLPPLKVQRSVGKFLKALDDKITANVRVLETANELVKNLYTAIPKSSNHAIESIGELVKKNVKPEEMDVSKALINLEHFDSKQIWISRHAQVPEATSAKSSFLVGDVLFGKLRPYFHKVGVAPIGGYCSTDVLVVRPREDSYRGLLLAAMSAEETVAVATQNSNGTRMPRAKWADIASCAIPDPDDPKSIELGKLMDVLIPKCNALIHENHVLARTRDELLPLLMSGRITVGEAEDAADEAASES